MNNFWHFLFGVFILIGCCVDAEDQNSTPLPKTPQVLKKHFEIVSFNWEHVEAAYTVTIWILVASIAKILFHVNKNFGDALPDSACLIAVGLIVGYFLTKLNVDKSLFNLDTTSFFLYLLPPIIFDAGYFMPNRQLFDNFDSVMVFAFIGTIFNTIAIALTLFLFEIYGYFSVEFSLCEILLFAALISAVDPVAVIAVFEEIHVNEFLFINVFGEAIFNDGAAVVLYFMFKNFNNIGIENLTLNDYAAGGLSFFVIIFGGLFIGLFFAVLVSFITKFSDQVKILTPVLIFAFPYLAYLTADMFGVSAIFAIIACGITMKEYVKGNVTTEANTSVKYFTKMLAQSAETIIFMFLGLSTISSSHLWDTNFVVITVAACLIYRTIGVIIQCTILNQFRTKQFTSLDQFVLSYGGLRGAIAFGLSVSMPATILAKPMFVTTTITVIFFTVFIQGITIRPLLNWLNVERLDEDYQSTLVEDIFTRYIDYTMTGIEDIAGQRGKHSIRHMYERINSKILKPILMKSYEGRIFDASHIVRAYAKITLQEAMEVIKQGQKPFVPGTPTFGSRKTTKTSFDFDSTSIEAAAAAATSTSLPPTTMAPLKSQQDIETFYNMFSKLLDKKIDEIRGVVQAETQQQITDNDIPDDYIEAIQPSFLQSIPNLDQEIENPTITSSSRGRRIRSENFHSHHRSTPNVSKIFPKEFV